MLSVIAGVNERDHEQRQLIMRSQQLPRRSFKALVERDWQFQTRKRCCCKVRMLSFAQTRMVRLRIGSPSTHLVSTLVESRRSTAISTWWSCGGIGELVGKIQAGYFGVLQKRRLHTRSGFPSTISFATNSTTLSA